jgi:phage terminase small subunit
MPRTSEERRPGLSAKHQRFVEEYLVDLNGTQAAIRAGYKEKSARFTAAELLARPDVQEAIEAERKRQAEAAGVRAERVLRELAAIAFADVRDLLSWGTAGGGQEGDPARFVVRFKDAKDVSPTAAAAIQAVSHGANGFSLKMHSKIKALELLAKHLGIVQPAAAGDAGGTGATPPTPLTPENVHDIAKAAQRRLARGG